MLSSKYRSESSVSGIINTSLHFQLQVVWMENSPLSALLRLFKGTYHLSITIESCQIQWGTAILVSMVCGSSVIHQRTYY